MREGGWEGGRGMDGSMDRWIVGWMHGYTMHSHLVCTQHCTHTSHTLHCGPHTLHCGPHCAGRRHYSANGKIAGGSPFLPKGFCAALYNHVHFVLPGKNASIHIYVKIYKCSLGLMLRTLMGLHILRVIYDGKTKL